LQVNKADAALALQEIAVTHTRTMNLRRYRAAAPYFIVWGVVWLVANGATDFSPRHTSVVWATTVLLGVIASAWINLRPPATANNVKRLRWHSAAGFAVAVGYFAALGAVLTPLTARQENAGISLFWAFLYMFVGIWNGWKIFVVGLATSALILIGYFVVTAHYFLWMGVVAGGALILSGLWIRRI
jgi:hypothetical protein